jgi:hypothetical protein
MPFAPTGVAPDEIAIAVCSNCWLQIIGCQVRLIDQNSGQPIWQRNYHEHIIRDTNSWEKIDDYVLNNPRN